jgi:hypothetical protein
MVQLQGGWGGVTPTTVNYDRLSFSAPLANQPAAGAGWFGNENQEFTESCGLFF